VAVGNQPTNGAVDGQITNLSVSLRNLMQNISNLSTWINGQNQGLTYLESLGYSTGDAQTVLTLIAYMNTISGVYYGTVQQGGSGGTGAIEFDYNNALSQLWAGQ
jgi:hypothetical protein